jgi:hypothetical protein
MRKLISPNKIKSMSELSLFCTGNSAMPFHADIVTYDTSKKSLKTIGKLFTTLPYVPMKLHAGGDDAIILGPSKILNNWIDIFGEGRQLGCFAMFSDDSSGLGFAGQFYVDGLGTGNYSECLSAMLVDGLFTDQSNFDEAQVYLRINWDNYDIWAQKFGLVENEDAAERLTYDKQAVEKAVKYE